jgi:hypothetical protein
MNEYTCPLELALRRSPEARKEEDLESNADLHIETAKR